MKPQKIIGTYFIALAIYLFLDFLWLGVVAKSFYQNQLGEFIGNFNWFVVFVFYLFYTSGLVYFVILPSSKQNPFVTALKGGYLGLLAYSAYNLTNLATIPNWPYTAALADTMWGFLVSFTTVFLSTALLQSLSKK